MGFKWMIIVLLQTTFAMVTCSGMVGKVSPSRKESVNLERETNLPKGHAIMSIQSEDGDIIDCIDIYKQPAFVHPALKNHKIQMNPSYDVAAESKDVEIVTAQTWHRSGSCPKGTIPLRRIQNDHGKRKATRFHYKKQFNDNNTLDLQQKNHSMVILHTEGYAYLGGKGDIKVWNPRVESDDEYSTSRVALKIGSRDNYEAIEAGWAVNPKVYGDRQTRLYAYWTIDGSMETGCFDMTCPGFVQTSNEIALGAAIYPISNPNGLPYEITILIHKDPNTSNWWIQYGERINIGYWPSDLFGMLRIHASTVQWGGEVYSPRVGGTPHTTTAMGSGKFPNFVTQNSGYIKRMRVLENNLELRFPQWVNSFSDEWYCYQNFLLSDYIAEPEFYFGGPGSYRNPMCP